MTVTVETRLEQAEARLTKYIAAEQAILNGAQSYSIGNRTLSRADLGNIQRMITRLYAEITKLQRGGKIGTQRVVPRDF